jgi:hypothetical protein
MDTVFVAISAAIIGLLVAGTLGIVLVAFSKWRRPIANEKGFVDLE